MSILSRLIYEKPLAPLSTFRIGGPARLFIEVKTIEEMSEVGQYINEQKVPFWVLGRGSNSLFDDRGFDGLVVLNSIRFCSFRGGYLHVGGGYPFSLLGFQTARRELSGLEFASGIPGSVGGAIFMNAGANGSETSDCLKGVEYINEHGKLEEKKRAELTFSYRSSSFQGRRVMIVGGTFALKESLDARSRQMKFFKSRIKVQPYRQFCAGCIFRNPPGDKSAGALIEACGLKGKRFGDAEVSPLHANFIVNRGAAKAADVLELVRTIRETVYGQTGVELEREICLVPYQLRSL